jgi:hypothetical protein
MSCKGAVVYAPSAFPLASITRLSSRDEHPEDYADQEQIELRQEKVEICLPGRRLLYPVLGTTFAVNRSLLHCDRQSNEWLGAP